MSVFDGLADIFADTFGEAVDYTPAGGVTKRIGAIWWDSALTVTVGDGAAGVDLLKTELHVRASDIAEPKEGDTATRVADGKTMILSTPILPDGKGMIVCNLVDQ